MKTIAGSTLPTILVGGLVAGTLDIGAAALINQVRPVTIAHHVASGVMGKKWAIPVVIATIYWARNRKDSALTRWWPGGLLAGVVIFQVMNFIVMPFSAAPVTLSEVIARFRSAKGAEDLLAMLVFGLI